MNKFLILAFIFFTSTANAWDLKSIGGIASNLSNTTQTRPSSLEERLAQKYTNNPQYQATCNPNTQRYCNKPLSTTPNHSPSIPQRSQEDLDLMSKGIWRDPATNLYWYRCPSDHSWSGQCAGATLENKWGYKLMDALTLVKKMNKENFLGYSDWRMASSAELLSLQSALRNQQTSDLGPLTIMQSITDDYKNFLQSNFVDFGRQYLPVDVKFDAAHHIMRSNPAIVFITYGGALLDHVQYGTPNSTGGGGIGEFRLVRGGVDNGEYANTLKSIDANNADIQHGHDLADQADKCAEAVRKNWVPKKGDLTNKGVVTEIRGNSLLMYSEHRRCLATNEFGDCTRDTIDSSSAWIPRADVSPSALRCYKEALNY